MGWGPEAVAESRQVGRHCHAAFLTPNILHLPQPRLHGPHRFSSPRLPFPFLPLLHVPMHACMSFVNIAGYVISPTKVPIYLCSRPLVLANGVANSARSSSPASTCAFVAFWPMGVFVSAINSLSIFSRVVRVRSSTSAALRWAVGMGGRTDIMIRSGTKCTSE